MGEHLPTLAMTLCDAMDHCHHANRSRLRLIDIQPRRCNRLETYPPFYTEAVACLSDAPLRHLAGPSLGAALTPVREAWLGLGPRCRGYTPGCYTADFGRLPPTARLLRAWRATLAACLRVPALEQPAPVQPLRLLLVDRPEQESRHITNVREVMAALRRRYPPDLVQAQLAYMEGLTLRRQAQLFSGTSLVVHAHGAVLGNYFFLPAQAAALQLSHLPGVISVDKYTQPLKRDLDLAAGIDVFDWRSTDGGSLSAVPQAVAAVPQLAGLDGGRPLYPQLLAAFNCSDELRNASYSEWNACKAAQIEAALYCFNFAVSPELLAGLIDKALLRVLRKQGRVDDARRLLQAIADRRGATAAEPGGDGAEAAQDEAELQRLAALAAEEPPGLGVALGGGSGVHLLVVCAVLALSARPALAAMHRRRKRGLPPQPLPLPKRAELCSGR